MGLSASQARLLTITARKSDCEFQSMRYSHEKIALSRNMTDISNEYQNSLNQTKLVYDFYGTGDASTQLSYGLLMTPSELNGYMPMLTTDTSGKVVLSSQYARAAEAAGIPKEGLGCLPGSGLRNNFYTQLYNAGIISLTTADTCQQIDYAQSIGMGSTDLVSTTTKSMNLEELIAYLQGNVTSVISLDSENMLDILNTANAQPFGEGRPFDQVRICNGSVANGGDMLLDTEKNIDVTHLTLADILSGDIQLLTRIERDNLDNARGQIKELDIWNWMFDEFTNILDTGDADAKFSLEAARAYTEQLLDPANGFYNGGGYTRENGSKGYSGVFECMNSKGYSGYGFNGLFGWGGADETRYATSDYIGLTNYDVQKKWSWWFKNGENMRDGISVDVTNIAKAFLTYFAQTMEGVSKSKYEVSSDGQDRTVAKSTLIDNDFMFNVLVDTGINTDQALFSGFYDTLFNQLCTRGWTENDNVTDKAYLQQMYQNGMFLLTTCADDGYYYQGNYGTHTYIKEVPDDEAIARAEAKYNTEKQKINHKEEIIDLKMKNLDTEISSLTSEYDTVKNLISKNIEKGFKRYDA